MADPGQGHPVRRRRDPRDPDLDAWTVSGTSRCSRNHTSFHISYNRLRPARVKVHIGDQRLRSLPLVRTLAVIVAGRFPLAPCCRAGSLCLAAFGPSSRGLLLPLLLSLSLLGRSARRRRGLAISTLVTPTLILRSTRGSLFVFGHLSPLSPGQLGLELFESISHSTTGGSDTGTMAIRRVVLHSQELVELGVCGQQDLGWRQTVVLRRSFLILESGRQIANLFARLRLLATGCCRRVDLRVRAGSPCPRSRVSCTLPKPA